MRTAVLVLLLSFFGIAQGFSQQISREEILATVKHMEAISRAQQSDLTKAKGEEAVVESRLEASLEAQQKLEVALHETAKERDVVLIAFAVIFALYFGTFFAGEILREFPTPWNLIACSFCYVVVFGMAYGLGRVVLHASAALIP